MRTALGIASLFIAATLFARSGSEFDGAWVLSGRWTGYMGLALKIRGDQYNTGPPATSLLRRSRLRSMDILRGTPRSRHGIRSPDASFCARTRSNFAAPATTMTASGAASSIAGSHACLPNSITASGRRADDLPTTAFCFVFHVLMRSTRN
jgi:hypothetical protein